MHNFAKVQLLGEPADASPASMAPNASEAEELLPSAAWENGTYQSLFTLPWLLEVQRRFWPRLLQVKVDLALRDHYASLRRQTPSSSRQAVSVASASADPSSGQTRPGPDSAGSLVRGRLQTADFSSDPSTVASSSGSLSPDNSGPESPECESPPRFLYHWGLTFNMNHR
ncbi:unnamed protein product [Protopolystoma xenopodis]|uniref:Uncharacterized protein n=1 Tax=Protopolystoma xenopodis TaxID=117903 RepID=A0A3S5B0K4_9PLAT|nr:unnamed protein product [Protopolystoma xenopodis]